MIKNHIEHTCLKPEATKNDILQLLDEAIKHQFFGVCINPYYVPLAKEHLATSGIKIVTVVGFPLGAMHTLAKALEAKQAIEDGADEIDMVINIGALKNKDYQYVQQDIETVKSACQNIILKVIIETDLLTKEEIIKACQLSIAAGAQFVKTSTGFVKNGIGATVENVQLMYDTVSSARLGVKASAEIRDQEKALALMNAGATRLGTSAGVAIAKPHLEQN